VYRLRSGAQDWEKIFDYVLRTHYGEFLTYYVVKDTIIIIIFNLVMINISQRFQFCLYFDLLTLFKTLLKYYDRL